MAKTGSVDDKRGKETISFPNDGFMRSPAGSLLREGGCMRSPAVALRAEVFYVVPVLHRSALTVCIRFEGEAH